MPENTNPGTEQPLLEAQEGVGAAKEINPTRQNIFIVFAMLYVGADLTYAVGRIKDAPDTAQGFRIGLITMFSLVNLLYLHAGFVDNTAFVDALMVAPVRGELPRCFSYPRGLLLSSGPDIHSCQGLGPDAS
jgi:hypothetical protein